MQERKNTCTARRILAVALSVVMLMGVAVIPVSAAGETRGTFTVEKVENGTSAKVPAAPVKEEPDPTETVRVSIVLDGRSTLDAGYSTMNIAENTSAMSYRDGLRREQADTQSKIETQALKGRELDVKWNLTLAANIISANVKYGEIEAIKAVEGVKDVVIETRYEPEVVTTGGEYKPNMAIAGGMTDAQSAWLQGATGAGSKIAIIDTGLDLDHQSFDPAAFEYALAELQSQNKTFDIMERGDLTAKLLRELNIYEDHGVTSVAGLYRSSKVPFAYNYVDSSYDVTHDNDDQTEHGSHVAGIAAANRYVDTDKDGVYEDALETVHVAGNAPDAQLLIMKVFGQEGGAYDSDYMAAIEDAIVLGADSVNLSLGSANAGNSTSSTYKDILDALTESDTVVVTSGGNNSDWAEDTKPGALYSEDVNNATMGTPGSYTNSLAVASIDNNGFVGSTLEVAGKKFTFNETSEYTNAPIATLDKSGKGTEYPFVLFDDPGVDEDGVNLMEEYSELTKNKIVMVNRGGGSKFYEKHEAVEAVDGLACIIINNQEGTIGLDLSDSSATIPCVSITQADGEFIKANSEKNEAGYYTGTIKVNSTPDVVPGDAAYYTISSFSSWGGTGDLAMKPELVAPGGNIYSVNGAVKDGTAYELMSGSSMAAPQVAGIAALVQQYLRYKELSADGLTSRALTQSLLMSTATPLKDGSGEYYPLLRQGAGLVNAYSAVSTPAYITVEGTPDGKVKAELGDDPAKTGVYTVKFTIHNLTGEKVEYALSTDVFTQAFEKGMYNGSTRPMDATVEYDSKGIEVPTDNLKYDFNGDGKSDDADAQALLDYVTFGAALKKNSENADVNGDGKVNTWDVHILLGNELSMEGAEDLEVTVTITLSDAERERLARENPTGAYVEAYIYAAPKSTEEGVVLPTLSVPVLAYYGNWTDPSMFDYGTGRQWYEDDFTDRYPYIYGEIEPLATNVFMNDYSTFIFDGDSVNSYDGVEVCVVTPIRAVGNGVGRITYTDAEGVKHVEWTDEFGELRAPYYSDDYGFWYSSEQYLDLYWQPSEDLPDGTKIEISIILAPEYYAKYDYDWEKLTDGDESNGELGKGAYLNFTFTLDNTAPEVIEGADKTYWVMEDGERHVYVTAKDNASVNKISLTPEDGYEPVYAYGPSEYGPDEEINFTPTGPDEEVTVKFDGVYDCYNSYVDGCDYWTYEDVLGADNYTVEVMDSAGNISTYVLGVDMEPTEIVESVTLNKKSVDLRPGETARLTAKLMPKALTDHSVTWSSSDDTVATVDPDGTVTGVSSGSATITATSVLGDSEGNKISAICSVNVYELKVTANGVFSDEDAENHFYNWNFEDDTFESYGDLAMFPDTAGTIDDESFYIFDAGIDDDYNYNMYKLSRETGDVIDGPWPWDATDAIAVWDMAPSKGGLNWTYYYFIMIEDNAQEPTYEGFELNDDTARLHGIASVDAEWEYTDDETGEKYNGDLIIFALDDENNKVYEFLVYTNSEGKRAALSSVADTDLPAYAEYGNSPWSNMVLGEDGALYYSVKTEEETSEIYRLAYDEKTDIYHSIFLGDFGYYVYPGLILEVTLNDPDAVPDYTAAVRDVEHVEAVSLSTEELAEVAEREESAPSVTPTGSLNSVDLPTEPVDSEDDSTGLKLDTENHTLTLPVYVSDFTNSKFTVSYNANVLDYAGIEPTGKTLVSAAVTAPGEITVGAAAAGDVDGKIAELTFTYDPASFERAPEFGMTLVEDNKTEISDPYEEPVGTVTIPAIEDDSTYDDETDLENCPSAVYTDAAKIQNEWYHEYVDYVTKKGVMKGRDDGSFDAYATLTRAELWTMLSRLDPTFTPETLPTDATWADTYQRWAMSAGVSDGTDPFRGVTRQEAVTMIYRFAKYIGVDVSAAADLTSFKDAGAVADWAGDAMSWAVAKGIIEGDDTGALNPNSTALRSHIAKIVAVYMQVI